MALSLHSYLGHARFKVGFVVAGGLVPLPSACFHSAMFSYSILLDQFGGCSLAPADPAYLLPWAFKSDGTTALCNHIR
ncbi:hypothetical protein D8674_042198 [Pyrus ussuriensis x Pyrus communis]|uniref:Uncharacterized protein n=1 Tax=Pyrus ussuriensis x Pyrus communis TaxID=2448454 RepID=A0A5N5FQV5_9ROSA|nr:hypothetical protein D8674_042198 [Pyrus ussuriensis x Pyrus communis]